MITLLRHLYTRADETINHRILNLIDLKAPAPATKLIDTTAVPTSDIPIDPSRNFWFRLFTPTVSDEITPLRSLLPRRRILQLRPGLRHLRQPLHKSSRKSASCRSFGRLPFKPRAQVYDDAFDALKFIDSKNSAILPSNTDLNRCFIGGDSAGGNIAHHLTVKAVRNGDLFEKIRIAGVVEVQPFFGGEKRTELEIRLKATPMIDVGRMDLMWRNFLPDVADKNHPAANACGGGDAEIRELGLTERYVEWMRRCGWEGSGDD